MIWMATTVIGSIRCLARSTGSKPLWPAGYTPDVGSSGLLKPSQRVRVMAKNSCSRMALT